MAGPECVSLYGYRAGLLQGAEWQCLGLDVAKKGSVAGDGDMSTGAANSSGGVSQEEVIDIEEYALNDQKVPKGKKYRIKIDREKYTVAVSSMTGKEILMLAGKTPPERYMLNQKLRGGKVVPITQDQTVDFTAPGIERFMTLPLDQQEG